MGFQIFKAAVMMIGGWQSRGLGYWMTGVLTTAVPGGEKWTDSNFKH
jgi:hypothetical protein